MTLDTALNLLVIALLIPTIVFAVILNRRLSALRRSRDELAKVVASFNDATLRAEAGIPKLKKATNEASMALKDRVEKAQALRDDLAFMIERAEEMATRLESGVRVARSEAAFGAAAGQPAAAPNAAPASPTLAGGLRPAMPEGFAPRMAPPPAPAKAAQSMEDTAADLRNALSAARAEARATEARLNPQQQQQAPAAAVQRPPRRSIADELGLTDDRSEAERELLKALQSTR
ncbi:MAG: hypothetical protein JNK21_02930 [Rhodospirillaceae bacterium]|nr:hypothetical protein [Rhodospirillaceae bacterium]